MSLARYADYHKHLIGNIVAQGQMFAFVLDGAFRDSRDLGIFPFCDILTVTTQILIFNSSARPS